MRIFTRFSVLKENYFNGFAALLFLMLSSTAFGQASITSSSAVTDALAASLGASSPTNWTLAGSGTSGNNFNGTTQTTGTGGGWYGNGNISFLGSSNATNGNATWLLQNNTGSVITGFTLSFTARMWKSGTASPSVTVSYANSASSTNPGAGALTNALSSLTFNDATTNVSTGTTLQQTVSSLSIANGQYIFIRFIHAGGSSSDNLGWDDLSFTPTLAATFTSTAGGGLWNSTGTWSGGVVPSAGSTVNIVGPVTINNTTGAIANSGTININTNGTLLCAATGASLTGTGTVNVNGTGILDIEQGGWPGTTNTFNYGNVTAGTGTLKFNNSSGSYGVNSTDNWFPATITNVNVAGAGGITLNSAHVISGSFQSSATVVNPGNITANGTLQLNSGYGWSGTGNPIYGASSLLQYNSGGSPGRAAEWTSTGGTIGTTAGYPNNVQVSNNTTLNFANGGTSNYKANGTLTVDAGSSLYQNFGGGNAGLVVGSDATINGNITLGTSSGDLFVGGNLTVGSAANFSTNGRGVTFNGTGTQTITKTGAGTISFDYFIIDKTAGSVVLSSSPATDVSINAASGNVLQLINTGGLDLNGRTMTFNNAGGGIYVNAARTINSTIAGGSLTFTNYKFVANNSGVGALTLAANVIVNLNTNGNLDFGKSGATYITTLNGTLSINSTTSCFVNTNPPIYGSASLLKYNSGGTYGRGLEWSTTSGAGYPNDVQVTNSTTINYPNTGNGGTDPFSTALQVARDLTVDSGSNLYMDYGGSGNKSGSLTVVRNVTLAGTMSLGNANGGDLFLAGNWNRTGTLNANGRTVNFNGASAQTLTGSTTFDYLTLSGNGGVTLQASSAVTVNNTLTLGSGGSTGKLTLGANTLTIGATGSISGFSSSAFIVTNDPASLLKRNSVGNTATSFPVGNLSTSYTPLTITNTGTTNDLSVASSATIDNAVTDATKIVTLQWNVVSGGAGAIGTIVYNWNTGNQAGSYNATGSGELGIYTTGPYAITALGTMSGQNKTVTGVALASGNNKMVIGNTGGVYTPPPTNDDCATPVTLSVNATATAGNNASATKSNPSTLTVSAYTTGTAKDMWYTFTATCSGAHTITMTPTGFDGAVALFTGGTCPNPTYTSSADTGASGAAENINFTATAGTTYRILVWGYNSSSGSFTIGVTSSVTQNFTLANTGTPATGNVAANTNNAVLYGFSLTPAACTGSFDFTAASITTSGTATTSDLSNFRLIVDANANGVADAGEISSPIGTVSTLANPLSFTVTGQTGLTAITRYLLIADVASGATGGNNFTASMTAANITATAPMTVSGTASGNTQTITAAAIAIADNTQVTAGNIIRGTTSNIISKAQLTVSGQNTTVTAMNFVTAGVSGGYVSADITSGGFKLWVNTTNSFGSATQVGSGVSSAKVTATSTETLSFTTSQNLTVGTTYYYWLTVDVAATATVNRTITVNGLTNASVVSAGTSITGSTTAAGAQTILAPTLVIANNTVVPAGNVLINSTGNIVARAQFTVTNATVSLSAMSYVTASNASGYTSADIATGGFKLWVSTTNSFGTATQVGTGQSSTKVTAASTETITFTSTQNLTAGVYYYWLTADIASAATAGKLIIVNGLTSASLTSTTTGVALSGTTTASGTQTIVAPTLTISNNTQITTQNLFAGSTNNIVSKAQVMPTNDNVSASAINFVTAGNAAGYTSADIGTGGFKLWVNTTNTFGTATQVGTGQSSTKTIATNTETITFTATQNFTVGNTYYYWLTADIAATPTVGDILVVNGLSGTSITTTTANAVVTGTTSATGNQTIVVPTVTLANTGAPATGSIAVGANNVLLFGFALTPNTSVDFTAASITTSGTATTSDLSNFRLIYDANANGVADTAEITGAIGTVSTLSGTLAFTGITGQTGFSTVRRYLLIADAASGATSGRTFTGNLTAANITTTATTNTGSAAGNTQTLVYVVAAGEVVINQLNPGYGGASDEYIELVNKTGKAFDMSSLKMIYYSAAGGSNASLIGTLSGTLQPYSFYLISSNATITAGATTALAADFTYASGGMAANNGQISLQRVSDNVQIDGVAYGTITGNAVNEGAAAPAGTTAPSVSIKRTIDGIDTNVNSADFSTVANASIYLRNSTGRLASAGATIPAGSYRDLSVTGASSIGGNVSISSQIRLDNNGILATSGNVLTLASTGAVSRISGWVNGSFKKNVATGATSRTFEIGGATFYRPVTVAFGSVTTAGDLTATLSPSAGDYPAIAASGIDAAKSVNRYWTLTNSGIAFTNYGVTFTFDASDVDGGANTANFIVRNYDGAWATSTAGTRTATTTQATGITTFGDFVIGESTGAPTIGTNPSNVTGCAATSTSFNSASSSVPTPAISWERGISGTYTTITGALDGGVYSGYNTATLSISNTSGLNGYTYRAVYTNINGTVTTTAATLTTGSTKTYASSWSPNAPTALDAAVITSNYSEVANITACSLTVTSGAVVIPSGNNVTLSGALVVSGGSFTLENNANLIQTGTTNNNSGNIVVKRDSSALKRLDYTLWSSPVTGQGLYAFTPFTFANRFYVYRTNTNFYNNGDVGLNVTGTNSDGVNGTDQAGVQFATAKGYLIRMPWNHPTTPTIWNGSFTGVPNNGDINYTMADNGAGFRFNLVGNPYPSPISMTQFVSDNSANITGTLYFWRETNNNTSNNAYCSWAGGTFVSNNEAQVVNPNGIIRTGQGFFVEGSGNGTTLAFKNGQRSSDNANQFFRTNNTVNTVDNNRFWLNLTSTAGEFAQMAAGYMEGATDGVDFYDGKNINTGNVLLNSILDNTDYTIQGKALPFNSADVIPLSYKVTNAGDYSIAIDHTDGLFAGSSQPIYLKDNLMNTEFDLQTGAYTFTSVAGSFTNRFEIVFQSQLGVENPVFNANTVVIYPHNNEFVINSGSIIMASVKVFDIRGRLIESKNGINASQTTIKGGLSNQVLLVQITSQDGAVVTKKIVR